MNDTITIIPVADLHYGCLDVKPVYVDWTDRDVDADSEPEWSEAFDHTDSDGKTWTLINANGSVQSVYINGKRYDLDDYDTAASDHDDLPIDEHAWERLFEVDPQYDNSTGPAMSYFYECPGASEIDAPYTLRGLPLAAVTLDDGTSGLALTGGGMDLSWEIVEAFTRLGYMPPVHYADLPAMAGRGTSTHDRYLIDASIRACEEYAEQITRKATDLKRTFGA